MNVVVGIGGGVGLSRRGYSSMAQMRFGPVGNWRGDGVGDECKPIGWPTICKNPCRLQVLYSRNAALVKSA
jgi:hypothetical protein